MGLFNSILGLPSGIAEGLGGISDMPEEEYQAALRPRHKSPLGIGGTLRDILGGLGDALLIANDADPSYAPKRKLEGIQDVMSQSGGDISKALPGVYGIDPGTADKMAGRQTDAYKAETDRQKEVAAQQFKSFETGRKFLDLAGSMAGGANPKTWPALRAQLTKIASTTPGMDVFLGNLPGDNATPEEISNFAASTMEYKDRMTQEFLEGKESWDRTKDVADLRQRAAQIGVSAANVGLGGGRLQVGAANTKIRAATAGQTKGSGGIPRPKTKSATGKYEVRADGVYDTTTGKKVS
jgi:hypothetical protein